METLESVVNFNDYYAMVRLFLKKKGRIDDKYFDTLDLLVGTIMINNDFNELEKIERLRDLVYSNGSLNKKELKQIDKELGYDKYYE